MNRLSIGFARAFFGSLLSLVVAAPLAAQPFAVGPNVNMVTGTRFPEGDFGLTKQNEVSLAVSSRHSRHLMAGSNDWRLVQVPVAEGLAGAKAWTSLYKSVDGGSTWFTVIPGGCPLNIRACNDWTGLTAPLRALAPDFSADPTIRPGPFGTFFFSYIAGTRNDSTNGVVAVQRFVDKNNDIQRNFDVRTMDVNGQPTPVMRPAEDPIMPDQMWIVEKGVRGQFVDKPWNAADLSGRPWNVGKKCELLSWTKDHKDANGKKDVTDASEIVDAFSVYVSFANFAGQGQNDHPAAFVAASNDCGNTFGKPLKVSASLQASQGTFLFLDPIDGTVYVAWRVFAEPDASPPKPDAIYLNKSIDGGLTWLNQPVLVAELSAYDQNATGSSFRTLGFATGVVSVASDGTRRVHVAWSQRKAKVATSPPYQCLSSNPADCDARVVIATSTNGGVTWLTPVQYVDNAFTVNYQANGNQFSHQRGHQVQPSLTFAAGKLAITWLDNRFDHTEDVFRCLKSNGAACEDFELTPIREAKGNLDPNCHIDVSQPPLSNLPQASKDLLGPADGACYEYRPGRPASLWTTYMTDGTPGLVRRHTLDTFAALADPANAPTFASQRISQYAFGATSEIPSKREVRQAEVNPSNLQMFSNGGAAFIGDYIDIAGELIRSTGDAVTPYKFNVGDAVCPPATSAACTKFTTGGTSPFFYVGFTDNRAVIPPQDGNWAQPTCLATKVGTDGTTTNFSTSCYEIDAQGNVVPAPINTNWRAGNRNQNVFSVLLAPNSVAYANANSKLLKASEPRGFVVTVENLTNDPNPKIYQASIEAPAGVKASFDRADFEPGVTTPLLQSVAITVQPRSAATRTVWVQSATANAGVVVRITSTGYSTQISLNPDPNATLAGNGDGFGADIVSNDIGNVVLSNAVLTNNVLSNNALSNVVLSNNALTNAALSNVVLSNNVLSNLQLQNLNPATVPPADYTTNVLTNNALSNVVLSNVALSNVVLSNDPIINAVLSNNALSNVVLSNSTMNAALTNIDPGNVMLSNAVLSNNALSNVVLSNAPPGAVMLSNAVLSNAALSNVVLSNNALSNNALSNNALSNVALSNKPLFEIPFVLDTITTANPDLSDNTFSAGDLAQTSNCSAGSATGCFWEASFTVRNRGNTDTTLALKLLLRDATSCSPVVPTDGRHDPKRPTRKFCDVPAGHKLQLVMRKVTFSPIALPPTAPATAPIPDLPVTFGPPVLRIGLTQSNAIVSNVAIPTISDTDDVTLGQFLPEDDTAATLPLSPGERAYVTIRAIRNSAYVPADGEAPPDPKELLRWGSKFVVTDASKIVTPRSLVIRTMAVSPLVVGQTRTLTFKTMGGFGTITGTAICTNASAVPIGAPCLPISAVPFTFVTDAATAESTKTISVTPTASGDFYLLLKVEDQTQPTPQEPKQTDQQLIKVTVLPAAAVAFSGSFDTALIPLNVARSYHTATLLCDGKIVVAGGFDGTGTKTATSEVYTFKTDSPKGTFAAAGNMPSPSAGHTATLIGDGPDPCASPSKSRVLVTGGGNASAALFSPSSKNWTAVAAMPSARTFHTATRLPDGRVFIAGGADAAGNALQTTLIYDPKSATFSNGPPLVHAREQHTAVLLTSTGEVLLAGGRAKSGSSYVTVKDAEIFHPSSPTMLATGGLNANRYAHSVMPLSGSSAVVVGGADVLQDSAIDKDVGLAEIYNTTSDRWSFAKTLLTARRGHGLADLGGGAGLVVGGQFWTGVGLAPAPVAEFFWQGYFLPGPTMVKPRYGHTTTPFKLTDGVTRVLVVGGIDAAGVRLKDAELYQ